LRLDWINGHGLDLGDIPALPESSSKTLSQVVIKRILAQEDGTALQRHS
jgi:hypothetical protein